MLSPTSPEVQLGWDFSLQPLHPLFSDVLEGDNISPPSWQFTLTFENSPKFDKLTVCSWWVDWMINDEKGIKIYFWHIFFPTSVHIWTWLVVGLVIYIVECVWCTISPKSRRIAFRTEELEFYFHTKGCSLVSMKWVKIMSDQNFKSQQTKDT